MKVCVGMLLLGWAMLSSPPTARSADGAANSNRRVEVWIISPEGSGPNDIAQGEDLPSRVEALRLSLAQTGVQLLNVEDPLAAKTRSWNPESTVPNFQVVANQRKTFAALARFAKQNDATVVLRLITWGEAFDLLRAARTTGPDALPDVMEVGSTWTGYLAANGRIRSRPGWQNSKGNWRDVLGVPACALPYITDVRLLFYWKRLPSAAADSPALTLNGESWPALLESFGAGTSAGDTIAFPTGMALSLLYDYVSLVKAGESGPIIEDGLFGHHVAFSGDKQLAIPLYLTQRSRTPLGKGEVRELASFPEAVHEEVTRAFVNGGYRATLEPASFIGRWADDFYQRRRKEGNAQRFWDYAAAVVPPVGFKGGGELVVLNKTPNADLAFKLADFLATDPEYTDMLAEAGFLPPGKPGYGLDALVASLTHDQRDAADARAFGASVQQVIDRGYRYPDFENWAVVLENQDTLEKFQRVWRRMAEGDVAGVRRAAKDLDWAINSQIYMPSRALNAVVQSWKLFALVFSMGAILLALAGLHRQRLRQVEEQFNMRLEERVNERTRIARELHDTLLQSLHGLMFQYQAARNMLPGQTENAMQALDEAISGTEQAIGESRDAIHDIRQQAMVRGDLEQLLEDAAEELAAVHNGPRARPKFQLIVEGEPRSLAPAVQPEVYGIARELLRNAFNHAEAQQIEVDSRYDENQLRVRVRDNGKGINPQVLQERGRSGHWGLPGIRERAQRIGAHLDFWSESGAGTEVELTVPATAAYKTNATVSPLNVFRPGRKT
ncbi:MAG TPA: histidine kinase [Candidatus Acidoferrales bacterium]